MSINWPYVGEQYSPAYQVSALPYLTSSVVNTGEVHKYEFPFVTRFINIVNRSTDSTGVLGVAFTERGLLPSVGNYITLEQADTVYEEIRTTALYISCKAGTSVNYELFCGLTTIPAKNFLTLTGSNGHPGVG